MNEAFVGVLRATYSSTYRVCTCQNQLSCVKSDFVPDGMCTLYACSRSFILSKCVPSEAKLGEGGRIGDKGSWLMEPVFFMSGGWR